MLDPVQLKSLAIELAAALPPVPSPDHPHLPVLDQSPRARAIRRILDITETRGWQIAITRALDESRARYVSDLSDDAVFALRDKMERFEDCAQTCCDPDDGLPAR